MQRSQLGVQLFELIVVLVLLMGIGGITVLSLGKIKTIRLLRDEALHLKSSIESLILRATQEEANIELALFRDHYRAHVSERDETLLMRKLKAPIHIERFAPQSPLHFTASGVSQPAHIILKGKEDICEIKIGLRGRVLLSCNQK